MTQPAELLGNDPEMPSLDRILAKAQGIAADFVSPAPKVQRRPRKQAPPGPGQPLTEREWAIWQKGYRRGLKTAAARALLDEQKVRDIWEKGYRDGLSFQLQQVFAPRRRGRPRRRPLHPLQRCDAISNKNIRCPLRAVDEINSHPVCVHHYRKPPKKGWWST